jgi:hypothetical protein
VREDSTSAAPTALLDSTQHHGEPPAAVRSAPLRHAVLGWASLLTRLLGALAVVVIGAVHLQAYNGPYAAVPTIGVLFLVNFAAATAIGVTLLLPLEHLSGRWAGVTVALVTAAGIGLAAVSLAMLVVSQHGTLFGFHEPGYDPTAISRSRAAEIVALGLLTSSLALRLLTKRRVRW